MQDKPKLPFFTLILMISFASVNAVLFTPALPNIALFFGIPNDTAQQTITWYLVGYALGQLLYGPFANRFGRKPTLFGGVSLQIMSSLLCVLAGWLDSYSLLILGRLLMALGAGVGLKMTFTLVNECYTPKMASQKISLLMLAFAITPGLAVALGGVLNEYFGWTSCFYAGALYGVVLLFFIWGLPETQKKRDLKALKLEHLIPEYQLQFKNRQLVAGGFLMGGATSFVYIFAALAPFIAMKLFEMSSEEYGFANLLPPIGLILGSLSSALLAKHKPLETTIQAGIALASLGSLLMLAAVFTEQSPLLSVFLPMIVIYFGLALILPNASTLAMSQVSDKAHGSAVMNFINMGLATLIVLGLGYFTVSAILLPSIFLLLCGVMLIFYLRVSRDAAPKT